MGCNCGGEKKITGDMIIGDVLKANPKTAEIFKSIGMHCLGCPSAAGESVAQAASVHGVELETLLQKLNQCCGCC